MLPSTGSLPKHETPVKLPIVGVLRARKVIGSEPLARKLARRLKLDDVDPTHRTDRVRVGVVVALAAAARRGRTVGIGVGYLAKALGSSVRTVERALAELVDAPEGERSDPAYFKRRRGKFWSQWQPPEQTVSEHLKGTPRFDPVTQTWKRWAFAVREWHGLYTVQRAIRKALDPRPEPPARSERLASPRRPVEPRARKPLSLRGDVPDWMRQIVTEHTGPPDD